MAGRRPLGDGFGGDTVSTATPTRPETRPEPPEPTEPTGIVGWITTTDHKRIGIMYAVTSLAFFVIGGALAGVIRAELAFPGVQVVDAHAYNQVFTIHGSVMIYLFAVPFAFALGNYLVPLQVGAADMAFPRLNALSYWMYLFGGLVMLLGFLSSAGAAAFGWTAYAPLSDALGSPGAGADLWIVSLIVTGLSGTLTAMNIAAMTPTKISGPNRRCVTSLSMPSERAGPLASLSRRAERATSRQNT